MILHDTMTTLTRDRRDALAPERSDVERTERLATLRDLTGRAVLKAGARLLTRRTLDGAVTQHVGGRGVIATVRVR